LDNNKEVVEFARMRYGSEKVKFMLMEEKDSVRDCDLCYVNGVFHHIPPEQRIGTARDIRDMVSQTAHVVVFENNMHNPGTRYVMKKIPFDKDAIPLSAIELRSILRDAGFHDPMITRYLFYFPKLLSALRPVERYLQKVPLGAQYCVVARKYEMKKEGIRRISSTDAV
jgi:hypothetical protein